MKQTAVDWLIAELFKKGIINADAWVWDESIDIKQIIEQTKEMEKEQIEDAYQDGWMSCEKWFEDEN